MQFGINKTKTANCPWARAVTFSHRKIDAAYSFKVHLKSFDYLYKMNCQI